MYNASVTQGMCRSLSVVLLAALAGAPVQGVACAVQCESARGHVRHSAIASEHHHAAAHEGHDNTSIFTTSHLETPAGHACGDHEARFETAALSVRAARHDDGALVGAAALTPVFGLVLQAAVGLSLRHPPPVPPPAPARASLVLRI